MERNLILTGTNVARVWISSWCHMGLNTAFFSTWYLQPPTFQAAKHVVQLCNWKTWCPCFVHAKSDHKEVLPAMLYFYSRWFLGLCVQGYLCLRAYQEQVVSLVSLMLDTGFPCFRRNSIEELRWPHMIDHVTLMWLSHDLRARFRPRLSEREAAKTIIEVVEYSCLNFRFGSLLTMCVSYLPGSLL